MKEIIFHFFFCVTQVLFIFLLKTVNSLPVTTNLYRSFDDEGERPRSTVRMSFGKSDSSSISAHSSHRAISSLHDAIDLHKQVKSTINGFKQLYRSTRKPKPSQRMGYNHPYANARTHPTSHNANIVAANEHIHEQNHPNLQYTSQHHFHEGNQMNHPAVIEHPSLNHQQPHYSLATEASRRSQRV